MSLNPVEQRLLDYIQQNPEEKSHWVQKVRTLAAAHPDDFATVLVVERELRQYHEERARVVPSLAGTNGGRLSMKNMAEYLVRMWTEPRPKKKKKDEFSG